MWFEQFPRTDPVEGAALTENGYPTEKGRGYVFSADLIGAIDVAIGLGRPLLVAGDPGCGKTELGYAVARRLGIPKLHFYSVKSTSEARDLFYVYDAIGRFRDAQIKQFEGSATLPDVGEYIEFQALGRAILDAHPKSSVQHLLRGRAPYAHPGSAQRSVVIIDEVDKAPRDFPNDLLREIEDLSFRIPEFARSADSAPGQTKIEPETPSGATIDPRVRPVIIITSNEERQLPDAFLRRCVFHHIPFPGPDDLGKIIENGLRRRGERLQLSSEDRRLLVEKVIGLRELAMQKTPGVSEIIDASTLIATPEGNREPLIEDRFARTAAALIKVKEDRAAFQQVFAVPPKL